MVFPREGNWLAGGTGEGGKEADFSLCISLSVPFECGSMDFQRYIPFPEYLLYVIKNKVSER